MIDNGDNCPTKNTQTVCLLTDGTHLNIVDYRCTFDGRKQKIIIIIYNLMYVHVSHCGCTRRQELIIFNLVFYVSAAKWLCVPFLMANPVVGDITQTAFNHTYQAPWLGHMEKGKVFKWVDDFLLVVRSTDSLTDDSFVNVLNKSSKLDKD